MPLPRRLSGVLAGGAAAVVLTACGGGPAPVEAAPAPTATESAAAAAAAAAAVRAAAAQTGEQGSSRYTLTTSTETNGEEVVFAGQGIFDWSAQAGQTTYDVPVGAVEQRLVGPDLYLALPQQPGVFFKLKAADVATTPLGGMVDPTAQLHLLAAVSEAEQVGQEEVRGEPTTRYRGSYDVARALAAAHGLQQHALRSSLGAAAGLGEATYDVFLDDEGRLRRLHQVVDVPASPQTGNQPLTVTATLELYDFGLPVTVVPPPGPEVRDGAPLLAALKQVVPKPPPAPAAAPPAKQQQQRPRGVVPR